MRKKIMFSLILTVCVVVLSFACVKNESSYNETVKNNNNKVLTVANNKSSENKALETRFLNMLNHNFVYDDAFYYDDELVNNSLLALLDVAEGSYVDAAYLSDYIFNMYGKIYKDYDFLGEVFTEKDGFVYIAPRGYSVYSHNIVSVADNKDGSYTVITNVEIEDMDGTTEVLECETVFLKAEDSAFGYNIMYSKIDAEVVGGTDC